MRHKKPQEQVKFWVYRMSFASIFLQVARFYGVELSAYEVNMLTNVP